MKLIATSFGAVLAGQSLKHSIQAGMSLAPIGEFSFIIAALGVSLNVTSGFLYPIVVAISAITTFTTPFLSGNPRQFSTLLKLGSLSAGSMPLTATAPGHNSCRRIVNGKNSYMDMPGMLSYILS